MTREQLRLEDYNLKRVEVRLRLIDADPLATATPCHDPAAAVRVLREYLGYMDREFVCALNLDVSKHPLNFHIVTIGSVAASIANMRDIFKTAILSNAHSILLMHNHPSGNIEPSIQDIQVTKKCAVAADIMGIQLLDHIIVGQETYYSFRERKRELFKEENERLSTLKESLPQPGFHV